jgi:hypothetical protein
MRSMILRLGHLTVRRMQKAALSELNSVTEESRLQSILAISVVSTKNALLQSQSHFDYDGATIR